MTGVSSNVFFMPPFPDGELVNHFIERLCHLSGYVSLAVASKRLLDRSPLLDAMPNDLMRFHREIGHRYCCIEVLLARHTLCDLHCCGLPLERFEAQRARLKGKFRGTTRLNRLAVMFAANEQAHLRCPECEKEQERAFGFTYTHRRTEVPFVSVCGIHGSFLESKVGKAALYDANCNWTPNTRERTMAQEYARRVNDAVETPAAQSPYHKDSVAERLRAADWVSPSGHLRIREFIAQFSSFFNNAFPDARLALLVEQSEYIEAALRAMFRRNRSVHPVWCVLMLWFAENCVFDRSVEREFRPGAAETLSRDVIEYHLRTEGTIAGAAKTLKVDATRLALMCKQLGIRRSWRTRVLTDDLVAAVNAALDADMSTRDIVKRYGVSDSTVYRLRASRARELNGAIQKKVLNLSDAKAEWEAARRDNPHLTTATLRRRHPAAWSSLRENDGDWLLEHPGRSSATSKPRRRKFPEELVAKLDVAVENASRSYAAGNAGPRKASSYRLQKLTGISKYALHSCVECHRIN